MLVKSRLWFVTAGLSPEDIIPLGDKDSVPENLEGVYMCPVNLCPPNGLIFWFFLQSFVSVFRFSLSVFVFMCVCVCVYFIMLLLQIWGGGGRIRVRLREGGRSVVKAVAKESRGKVGSFASVTEAGSVSVIPYLPTPPLLPHHPSLSGGGRCTSHSGERDTAHGETQAQATCRGDATGDGGRGGQGRGKRPLPEETCWETAVTL